MKLHGNWSYPTNIHFGAGRITELASIAKEVNINNPLLVTDKGLSKLPISSQIREILFKDSSTENNFFYDVDPNPTEDNLNNGIEVFLQNNHDGVIAFGGGSGLDLGKLIAFMAKQELSVWEFEDIGDNWKQAKSDVIYPSIAIPTTAGTGSEVGRAGVLTNKDTRSKKIIFHPAMMPKAVICDPQSTLDLPPHITAGTGMDAFAHCLEAYCAPNYHPQSQGIAVEGIRLVKENLVTAFKEPKNLTARAHMMSAALMGAVAFQKGLGAVHALSHPLGAYHHTHHGTTNALFFPAVLKFNRDVIEDDIIQLAKYLNIDADFDSFVNFVVELNETLKIPKTLKELGVDNPDFETLAKSAINDPSLLSNPKPMTVEEAIQIYQNCQ